MAYRWGLPTNMMWFQSRHWSWDSWPIPNQHTKTYMETTPKTHVLTPCRHAFGPKKTNMAMARKPSPTQETQGGMSIKSLTFETRYRVQPSKQDNISQKSCRGARLYNNQGIFLLKGGSCRKVSIYCNPVQGNITIQKIYIYICIYIYIHVLTYIYTTLLNYPFGWGCSYTYQYFTYTPVPHCNFPSPKNPDTSKTAPLCRTPEIQVHSALQISR